MESKNGFTYYGDDVALKAKYGHKEEKNHNSAYSSHIHTHIPQQGGGGGE